MIYKVKSCVKFDIELDVNADSKEEAEYIVRVYAKDDVAKYAKNFDVDVIETKELTSNT